VPNVFDIFDESIDQRIREALVFYFKGDPTLNQYLGGQSPLGISDRKGFLFSSDTSEELPQLSYPFAVVAVGIGGVEPGVGTIDSDANLEISFFQQLRHRIFSDGEKDISALEKHVTRLFWDNPYLCTDLFLDSPGVQTRMTKRAVGIVPPPGGLTAAREEGTDLITLKLTLSMTWELEGNAWLDPPSPEVIP